VEEGATEVVGTAEGAVALKVVGTAEEVAATAEEVVKSVAELEEAVEWADGA
jgi:hypothetical protein